MISKHLLISTVAWSCLAGAALAASPIPVSPGAASRFAAVGSDCPTFSWSAVDGAVGYELVVYRAAEEEGATDRSAGADPVIRQAIAGRALSWTPSADDCLEWQGAYAWSVRETGGEWSESRLFRIEAAPPIERVGAAVERALVRFLGENGLPPESAARLSELIGEEMSRNDGAVAAAAPVPHHYVNGERYVGQSPEPQGVFNDEVELWLAEGGSGASDKVQLVFATPEFDGEGLADAWSIVVNANDTASADDGTMFFSTPSFFDAMQLYTDASVIISELRELTLRRLSSPPVACTSLQEGMFYWDDDLNELCDCNGTSWAQVDGGGGCS